MSDQDHHVTLEDLSDTLSRIMLLVEELHASQLHIRAVSRAVVRQVQLGQRPCPTCGAFNTGPLLQER